MHIDLYGTFYVYSGAVLGACVLLRCLKTPFVDLIADSASIGQALFFSALNLLRNISLAEDGTYVPGTIILPISPPSLSSIR